MVTFVGDVFPKEPVEVAVDLPGTLVINLEAPLTDHAVGYPGKINLRGSAEALALTLAGRSVVATLANNHCLDFYEPGVRDTLEYLEANGVPHCGVGTESDGWRNPALFDAGVGVAVLAYADPSCTPVYATSDHPGAAPLEPAKVSADIAAARAAGAERVVVAVHWGDEQVTLPQPRCVDMARGFVDAGADVVIGHHAHCIQSYETYEGKPIMYGLGNCIFPAHRSPSYFGTDGKPTRVKDTRPSRRNRRSLALVWDPVTGRSHVKPLYFDGARLVAGRFGVKRFELKPMSGPDYEVAYARSYRMGKLAHTLHNFMARPKVPRISHLRNVGKMMRTDQRQ